MNIYKNIFIGNKKYQKIILATVSIITIGSIVYHYIEGWSWIDSIYFSAITLTTVGYGDFSPQTDIGKIFTVFYVITGIGLMFSFINSLYEYHVNKVKKYEHEHEHNHTKIAVKDYAGNDQEIKNITPSSEK